MRLGLGLSHATLKGQEDQVGATANAKFIEQVGDVKLYSSLGNIEFAGDFLVGKILEQRVENFLFTAAKIGDGFGLEAATLTGKDGVDETRKHGTGHPETTLGNERKCASKLIARFGVG